MTDTQPFGVRATCRFCARRIGVHWRRGQPVLRTHVVGGDLMNGRRQRCEGSLREGTDVR